MRAQPFFFECSGRRLFGWRHAAGGASRRTAVVLCPPLGYEYMSAYRTWRVLAERIAAEGFDVIRFDYLGTGESSGGPEDPGQVGWWLRSIESAVAEARSRTEAHSVVLIGLRLGATLAAAAAARIEDIDGLVLWDAFRTGRRYVREVRAFAQLGEVPDAAAGEDAGIAGFLLTGDTARDLSQIDLNAMQKRPAARVLVIDRADRPAERRLRDTLEALGAGVTEERLPGTAETLESPLVSEVPEQILGEVLAWLGREYPTRRGAPVAVESRESDALSRDRRVSGFYFGPDRRLFGMLDIPEQPAARNTAILVLNTGCQYRVGPHRFYVPSAGHWADLGYHTFRFDLGGIGDSAPPPGVEEQVAYPAHALADIEAAIAELRARSGARRIVLVGICAGAWHSFLAARDGLGVDGIVAMNPPLYLREGPGFRREALVQERKRRRELAADALGARWKNALRRRASLRNVARATATALWDGARETFDRVRPGANREGLEEDLALLVRRHILSRFVYSRTDLSLTYFELNARRALRRSPGLLRLVVVNEADHTFAPLAAQAELREIMRRFLEDHERAAPAESSAVS